MRSIRAGWPQRRPVRLWPAEVRDVEPGCRLGGEVLGSAADDGVAFVNASSQLVLESCAVGGQIGQSFVHPGQVALGDERLVGGITLGGLARHHGAVVSD